MPTIHQLSQAKQITGADELAVFSKQNGDTRKITVEQLSDIVLESIEGTSDDTIYSLATDGDSFTLVVVPASEGDSAWAQITLSGPAQAGTLVLPGEDDRAHGQEVLVTGTQTVGALAVNTLGAMLSGAPSSIGPATPFRLKFDSITLTWYRIA